MNFPHSLLYQTLMLSPLGDLLLQANETSLIAVVFDGILDGEAVMNSILEQTICQLNEYFEKKRVQFDLPLEPHGTVFQEKVWEELVRIPYGHQVSYLQLSKNMGNVLAIRAVASANGKNPIPIIIPCHRVVGSKGELTGFSGGLWRKQWLLQHEGLSLF